MTGRSPGGLGRLRVRDGAVHLEVLDDDGHHLSVAVPVDHAELHALHHLHALHEGGPCSGRTRRPGVDTLVDAVVAAGGRVEALAVSAGPPVRFQLGVDGPTGRREVDLDVLDAAAIIFSRRVRLEVRAPAPDWDRALAELLDEA